MFHQGLTLSRAYSLDLNMYEDMYQIKFTDTPTGKLHYEKIAPTLADGRASSLLSFVENCNHIHAENDFAQHGFYLNTVPGKLKFRVNGNYVKGQEFNYQYQRGLSNSKCVFNYGFFYRENPYKNLMLSINFHRNIFTPAKYELAKELNLLKYNQEIENFFKQTKFDTITMDFALSQSLDEAFLKFVKMLLFTDPKLDQHQLRARLMNDLPLDYDSEIRSMAYLRSTIIVNEIQTKLKLQLVK